MKSEKRFYVFIKKSISGFFTINGRKVRTPVKFIALESEIPLIKTSMMSESITDFEIKPIVDDNKESTLIIK